VVTVVTVPLFQASTALFTTAPSLLLLLGLIMFLGTGLAQLGFLSRSHMMWVINDRAGVLSKCH
jgi:hypothetical protein